MKGRPHAGVDSAGRVVVAIAIGLGFSVIVSGPVSADTGSFVPLPDEPARDSVSSLIVPALLAILAVGALALVSRRPRSHRPIGAVLAVLLLLFGVVSVLAGFFGDLSGQRQVFILPVAIGLASIALSGVGLWRLRRRPARSELEPTETANR